MKTIVWIALASVLPLGCTSSPFRHDPDRSAAVVVDDELLVYVPENDRESITRARTERSEMKDRVAIAERDVEQEKLKLKLAREELEGAEFEVSTAEKGLEIARNNAESVRESGIDEANRKLDGARARWRSAQMKIAFHETHVSQLESHVSLASERLELAEARVELAKAKAVHELDRPEAREISVEEFEAWVAEKEARVAMAEVDAEAWEKKVKVRQDSLDANLEGRPDDSQR